MPFKIEFAPDLLEDLRRRFEETPESLESLGRLCGVSHSKIRLLAAEKRWVKFKPRRDLPEIARIEADAVALEASLDAFPLGGNDGPASAAPDGNGDAAAQDETQSDAIDAELRPLIERHVNILHALERGNLTPRTANEIDRAAQTLVRLTHALERIHNLRAGAHTDNKSLSYADDMPADIDAFRDELARRIDAFVASREDEEDAGSAPADDGSASQP